MSTLSPPHPAISEPGVLAHPAAMLAWLRTALGWPLAETPVDTREVSLAGLRAGAEAAAPARIARYCAPHDPACAVWLVELPAAPALRRRQRAVLRALLASETLTGPVICTLGEETWHFVRRSGMLLSTFGWDGARDPHRAWCLRLLLPRLRPDRWEEAFSLAPSIAEYSAALGKALRAVECGVEGVATEARAALARWVVLGAVRLRALEGCGWLSDGGLLAAYAHLGGARWWAECLHPLLAGRTPDAPARGGVEMLVALAELLEAQTQGWDRPAIRMAPEAVAQLVEGIFALPMRPAPTEPWAVDVGVTPDVLGYCCEALLSDQHGQGAFYTPPAELACMCQESLRLLLQEWAPSLDGAALTALLTPGASAASLSAELARELFTRVHAITVADPAVGAGAFPLALARHLTALLERLEGWGWASPVPADRWGCAAATLRDGRERVAYKRHLMTQAIWGGDPDPLAVRVARLRGELEVAAESATPVPLPNLGLQLQVGDTLVCGLATPAGPMLLEERFGAPAAPPGWPVASTTRDALTAAADAYAAATHPRALQEALAGWHASVRRALEEWGYPTATPAHLLWPLLAPRAFHGEQPGFDLLIGNPPYIRQELIEQALAASGGVVDKGALRRVFAHLLDGTVSGKADLYIYFFLRALHLVRNGGAFCFVSASTWLDGEFGRGLRAHLARATELRAILDSQTRRSFAGAQVNTTITLGVARPPAATAVTQFVAMAEGVECLHALPSADAAGDADLPGRRRIVAQAQLAREAAEAWSGRYLRAPAVFAALERRLAGQFTPLHALAPVRYGIKSGANSFFYLTREAAEEWGIEAEFLLPVFKGPREAACYAIAPEALPTRLFACDRVKAELQGTRALAYIEYGERLGVPRAPSLGGRTLWWACPREAGTVFWPKELRARLPVFFTTAPLAADCRFYVATVDEPLQALLNCSLLLLWAEVLARDLGGGGGPRSMMVYEVQRVPVPARVLTAAPDALRTLRARLAAREVLPIHQEVDQADRRELDALVCEVLGIPAAWLDDLYRELVELVARRMAKAEWV
jgi:hypothetical protein